MYQHFCDPTVSSEQVQQVCATPRAVATHPVFNESNSEQTVEEFVQTKTGFFLGRFRPVKIFQSSVKNPLVTLKKA